MSVPRIRKCDSDDQFERVIDELSVQGYEVLDRGERSALLRERSWGSVVGHVVVLVATIWVLFAAADLILNDSDAGSPIFWLIGTPNILYAVYGRNTARRVNVVLADPST